uniref:Pentatricopeptide repeat-containing protein n=1 Tax=Solanum lycopersicum TaxID=4081 RepID=K4D7U6_SOLLC
MDSRRRKLHAAIVDNVITIGRLAKMSDLMIKNNLRLRNFLLSMFVRLGNLSDAWYFDEALDLYQRMLWVGIRPDVYTFPCVLEDLWGLPDWRIVCSAKLLFDGMSKRDRILGMFAVQECCYDFRYVSRFNFNSGLIHLLASV